MTDRPLGEPPKPTRDWLDRVADGIMEHAHFKLMRPDFLAEVKEFRRRFVNAIASRTEEP